MAFQKMVPESFEQMYQFVVKLHENKNHVKSIKVDTQQRAVLIDLDFAANFAGHSDVLLPLKSNAIVQAKEAVQRLKSESDAGQQPGRDIAERLYNCIDQSAR